MVDYHCHLLPGIDDGAKTIEESVEMAHLLVQKGYSAVYCTPHLIKDLYDADNTTVKKLVKEVQSMLDRKNIKLQLLYGREFMADDHFHEFMNNLMPLENTRYLLVEFTEDAYQGMVRDTVTMLIKKGFIPMIAHPERCKLFQKPEDIPPSSKQKTSLFKKWMPGSQTKIALFTEPTANSKELLDWLVSMKCAFQANLLSFKGGYGRQVKQTALQLRDSGIYTHTGTDGHSPEYLKHVFQNTKEYQPITTRIRRSGENDH